MHALEIRDIKKTYASGTIALKGVSFELEEGKMLALLGANGAGKSTLIGILCGLVNKSSGSVRVFDVDPEQDAPRARSFIGIVPQEMNFSIFERVFDIVVDAAGYYGVPRSIAKVRVQKILKDLGLWEKRFAVSRSLSGGMKRRLLIARALIHEPKLLLLDEPSAGVDVELRMEMWKYIQKLHQQGMTIVLTTHNLEEAERLCEKLVMMKQGEIVLDGDLKELMYKQGARTLEQLYLEVSKSV